MKDKNELVYIVRTTNGDKILAGFIAEIDALEYKLHMKAAKVAVYISYEVN